MGEIVVNTFVTLDGVMQAPGGPEEDTAGGFRHGGWQAPYFDEEAGALVTEGIERMDAMLLGRKTYDIFASYWPKATSDKRIADKFNQVPKYVASRSARKLQWKGSTLIQGDVPKELAKLKQKHRAIHVWGSGDLLQTLLRHEFVDRFNVWVHPVLLGTGKRLFGEGITPTGLRLTEAKPFSKGVVLLAYQKAGKPRYGDMTVEAERAR